MKNRPKPLYIIIIIIIIGMISIYIEKKSCLVFDKHYKENTTIDNIYEVDCTIFNPCIFTNFLILGSFCRRVQAWKVVSVTWSSEARVVVWITWEKKQPKFGRACARICLSMLVVKNEFARESARTARERRARWSYLIIRVFSL